MTRFDGYACFARVTPFMPLLFQITRYCARLAYLKVSSADTGVDAGRWPTGSKSPFGPVWPMFGHLAGAGDLMEVVR